MASKSRFARTPLPALILLVLACACPSRGESVARRRPDAPSPVTYSRDVRRDPNHALHVVTIDLADPRVSVAVSRGGPDPDGDGRWTTTLLPVREIAEREGFDVAVNGDFFEAQTVKDARGKDTGFVRGKWAGPVGPAGTNGDVWKQAATTRPALLVGDRAAVVQDVDPTRPIPPWARQVVAGNVVLVRDGAAVPHANRDRHPRTVAGVDKAGTKLILLVVDGRQKDLAIGMTYDELAREMVRLGAHQAVNLDGGGSTTLVMRDAGTKDLKVVNSPSDGKERAVANVLGIRVKPPQSATRPAE